MVLIPYQWISAAALMVNIFYGIAIYSLKPKGKVNRFYTLIAFFMSVWLLGEMMMQRTIVGAEADFWARFSFIGLSFVPSLLLEFSTIYPVKRRFFQQINNLRAMLYAPSFAFLFLTFSSKSIVKGLLYQYDTFFISYGDLFPFYAAYFVLSLSIALVNAIESYWESKSPVERRQLALFMVGVAILLLVGAFVDMIPYIVGGGTYRALNIASLFSMGVIGFAVGHHGLADIKPSLESIGKKTDKWDGRRISPGTSYIIQEAHPEKAYKLFVCAIHQGWYGLCFTRELPDKVRERYDITTTPLIWLTEIDSKDPCLRPQELEMISHTITEFIDKSENSVVILDALEYLVTYNDFNRVLRMIQHIRDVISTHKAVLLISINPATLEDRQTQLLLRELEEMQ